MCSTITCCFSLPTPSSPAPKSSRNSRPSLVSPPSWRSRSVTVVAAMGLAQAMIGIGVIGNLYFFSGEGLAIAEDVIPSNVAKQRVSRVQTRWSDKRACPPWQSKSFELVVPENLPRRTPHRRWESVGDFSPSVIRSGTGTSKESGKCFSL